MRVRKKFLARRHIFAVLILYILGHFRFLFLSVVQNLYSAIVIEILSLAPYRDTFALTHTKIHTCANAEADSDWPDKP